MIRARDLQGPRFPFASLMLALLFGGGVFLVFNAPLLLALVRGRSFEGVSNLFQGAIIEFWSPVLQGGRASILIPTSIFLIAVFGFILKPLEQLVIMFGSFFARALQWVFDNSFGDRWLYRLQITDVVKRDRQSNNKNTSIRPFSPAFIYRAESPVFIAWLIKNKHAKSHWEWEYFLYQTHWSLCTNVCLFVAATVLLTPFNAAVYVCSFAATLFVLLYGVARCFTMAVTHEHYIKVSTRRPPRKTSTAPSGE